MADQVKPTANEGVLISAATALGSVLGNMIARGSGRERSHRMQAKDPDDLYRAEYLGSGTFVFRKPKRRPNKVHQSRVRGPRRSRR